MITLSKLKALFRNKRKICFYCKTSSKLVEASGLRYCPNLLCCGPGATWFRSKLKSYKEVDYMTHEVDEDDWKIAAFDYLKAHPNKGLSASWVEK